ncbi:hypothetical protein [Mycolicibacterium smegmatis]|uniref:Uncharacterized protein n=1 Tax=Mycolicibacterium smegmatis (strain MKD8) TaxID=1214915 RepID=A0A2U9PQ92_MYCSE|nr:hypothetical protein [Mycolicibacterium smegmatis]AWT53858.1 hypothetical protein D806_028840 [Mycolicibacterium smegmatis MKD8]
MPHRPYCALDGCRRRVPRSGGHRWCSTICARFDTEFDRLRDLCDDTPESTEAWVALVEAADAWTHYLQTRRALCATQQAREH